MSAAINCCSYLSPQTSPAQPNKYINQSYHGRPRRATLELQNKPTSTDLLKLTNKIRSIYQKTKLTHQPKSRGSRKRKHRPLNNKFLNLCCIVNVPKKFSHTQSMLFPSISLFSTGCTLPAIECLLLMNDLIERFEEGRKKQEQTT